MTPSTTAAISSSCKRRANAREAACQAGSAPATAARPGSQATRQERQPPEHQRDREVVKNAHRPERDRG